MKMSPETEQLLLRFFKSIQLCEILFVNSHIGYVIARRDSGQFLVVNNTFVEMSGYSRKELLRMRYRDIVPEESVPWIRQVILSKLDCNNRLELRGAMECTFGPCNTTFMSILRKT